MTTSKTVVCAIALVACLCAGAGATNYTFTETSGDWNYGNHWTPAGGPPTAGDTANIPAGTTCIVADADQAAGIVNVASGGTLQISNRHLTMNNLNNPPSMTINGTVEFANTSVLIPSSDLSISGSGQMVTASGATAYVGWVLEDWFIVVTVNRGVTVKGSFKFYCSIHNDGVLAVDDASHDMEIGEADSGGERILLNGNGTYRATAGQLRIGKCSPECLPEAARVVVNGGTFNMCSGPGIWDLPWGFTVSAGTLIFDRNFSASGHFDFSGGTIQVKYDRAVNFSN